MLSQCRICRVRADHPHFLVREMMFGSGEEFQYFECSSCGCLQIAEVPANLSKYYPKDYYSFSRPTAGSPLKRRLRRFRTAYLLGRGNGIGRMLAWRYTPPPKVARRMEWLRRAGAAPDDSILDVGCGGGHHLLRLFDLGLSNLTGIDPYLDRDIHYPGGVVIWKRELSEQDGAYDFIMLHHSFEHMPDPFAALSDVRRLLKPGHCALVRIPVTGCEAWRIYGPHWVSLDAPRHLFLYNDKSMRILAEAAGLRLEEVVYDSTGRQFWGSELFRRGIPLSENGAGGADAPDGIFSAQELRSFEERAEALNRDGRGDIACFYLRRPV